MLDGAAIGAIRKGTQNIVGILALLFRRIRRRQIRGGKYEPFLDLFANRINDGTVRQQQRIVGFGLEDALPFCLGVEGSVHYFSALWQYLSSSSGDSDSTSALLSKPWPRSSAGKPSGRPYIQTDQIANCVIVLAPIEPGARSRAERCGEAERRKARRKRQPFPP